MTLNMLRANNINPSILSYEEIYGKYTYNNTPLAPPGSRGTVYKKPNQRTSWGTHGATGYYIGPAMMYYRALTFYLPRSGGECVTDTASLYPECTQVPV